MFSKEGQPCKRTALLSGVSLCWCKSQENGIRLTEAALFFPLADFVLEVDGNLSPGAQLVLGKQWKQSDELPPSHADTESLLQRSVEQQQQQEEEETEDTSGM